MGELPPPFVRVDGLANLRDIGGWPVESKYSSFPFGLKTAPIARNFSRLLTVNSVHLDYSIVLSLSLAPSRSNHPKLTRIPPRSRRPNEEITSTKGGLISWSGSKTHNSKRG
jgi:hypothetical protein